MPLDGQILAKGDRTPVPGVSILVDDGAASAQSGPDGGFAFPALSPGRHTFHLRGGLAGTVDVELALSPGKRTRVTWYVSPSQRHSSTVRGRRVVQEAVEQSLTPEEVKRIPGTQGDTVKAVQNLPGVARPPFGGGLLVVWGSAPEDTRAYVDGVFVPTVFHFAGLRSTVNSELVQSLDFLPGGYGVDHGRGLGGVVEVESRRPRSDGYHGYFQVDLIDVSALVEGPIAKNLEFAAAGRISWLHLYLPAFITDSVTASPHYWDYQVKLSYRPTPRDDLSLFAFGSDDQLSLILRDPDPQLALAIENHTYFHRALLRWQHRFEGGATVTITPSVGYDLPDNRSFATGGLFFPISSSQLQYTVRAVARVPLHRLLRLDAGVDFEGTRFRQDRVDNPGGGLRDGDPGGFAGLSGPDSTQAVYVDHLDLWSNHVAPFASLVFSLFDKRLIVSPQLRADVISFNGSDQVVDPRRGATTTDIHRAQLAWEPRISLRAQLHPLVALKAAVGLYHQPPAARDLSLAFGNPELAAAQAIHYVLGLEVRPLPSLQIELLGFYKDLRDLTVRTTATDGQPLVSGGEGRVYGGQLLVRQELWKNFFGWLSYTVSRSERRDHPGGAGGDAWRLFQYDQTHILTVLGSYRLPYGFQVGLRFRYTTGYPYTPVRSAYYDVSSDSYTPIFGATYSARLPAFNQLDLRVDKEFVFDRWKLVVYLDLQNLYAAKAAETATYNYNFTQQSFVGGLPFLPVLGVRGEF